VAKNLEKRLVSHNAGKSKYTRRNRPWRLALAVRGFSAPSEARSFEWAWKHPTRTKRGRLKKRKSGYEGRYETAVELVWAGDWKRTNPDLHFETFLNSESE
jgi:structure-specific endonuclease subunit SLX1